MANIKILKEDQLVGGTDNTPVYPVSSTQAIYCQDSEGNVPQGVKPKLEDRLRDIENSISEVTITQPTVPDISTSISSDGASDTKTASPKAVKTYVDTATAGIVTSSTTGLKIEVVASLPANPDSNTIYIVQ